ncbi:uncharacterized protein METZ01_LOCUS375082, partial [marine metagenome]
NIHLWCLSLFTRMPIISFSPSHKD